MLSKFDEELSALKQVNPYSIITTNYDRVLEKIFLEYEPVIGRKILNSAYASIGEVFKIHGCVSSPDSLILTSSDYEEFTKKKKYLSAKLLTFFVEHPLFILGYSAQDSNIKAILGDIDEIFAPNGDLVPNIYLVEWAPDAKLTGHHSFEKLISVGEEGRSVRVKCIVASDFKWFFEALSSGEPIENVNPKILRAVLSRTFDLVRRDIPSKKFEVDFTTLEHAVETDEGFAKLYGITTLSDPCAFNATYPFTLTQVANQLGFNYWNGANDLLKRIKEDKGHDLKSSDNKYHTAIKMGSSQTHKYSQACLDLLTKIKQGQDYELDMS
ncbi:MAG: SIR2 family protein [Reinekea sp.]